MQLICATIYTEIYQVLLTFSTQGVPGPPVQIVENRYWTLAKIKPVRFRTRVSCAC